MIGNANRIITYRFEQDKKFAPKGVMFYDKEIEECKTTAQRVLRYAGYF
jgi:hypothetical protein